MFTSLLVLAGLEIINDQVFLELSSINHIVVQLRNSSFGVTRPFVDVVFADEKPVYSLGLSLQPYKEVPDMPSSGQR
jgi:hypothetical protein